MCLKQQFHSAQFFEGLFMVLAVWLLVSEVLFFKDKLWITQSKWIRQLTNENKALQQLNIVHSDRPLQNKQQQISKALVQKAQENPQVQREKAQKKQFDIQQSIEVQEEIQPRQDFHPQTKPQEEKQNNVIDLQKVQEQVEQCLQPQDTRRIKKSWLFYQQVYLIFNQHFVQCASVILLLIAASSCTIISIIIFFFTSGVILMTQGNGWSQKQLIYGIGVILLFVEGWIDREYIGN